MITVRRKGIVLAVALFIVGAGVGVWLYARQEARNWYSHWIEVAVMCPAADSERVYLRMRKHLGIGYFILPREDRRVAMRALSTQFFWEGDYGRASQWALQGAKMLSPEDEGYETELAFSAYLSALAKDRDGIRLLAARFPRESWKPMAKAFEAWAEGRLDDVVSLRKILPEPSPKAGADDISAVWVGFMVARALTEKGKDKEALEVLTKGVIPRFKAVAPAPPVLFHMAAACASAAEKTGDTQTALDMANLAVAATGWGYSKSKQAEIRRMKTVIARLQQKTGATLPATRP